MLPGAHNLPDDVIETAGRRVGVGVSIVCIAVLSLLAWVAVLGIISIVRDSLS